MQFWYLIMVYVASKLCVFCVACFSVAFNISVGLVLVGDILRQRHDNITGSRAKHMLHARKSQFRIKNTAASMKLGNMLKTQTKFTEFSKQKIFLFFDHQSLL